MGKGGLVENQNGFHAALRQFGKLAKKKRDMLCYLTRVLLIPPISRNFLALNFRYKSTRYGVSAIE